MHNLNNISFIVPFKSSITFDEYKTNAIKEVEKYFKYQKSKNPDGNLTMIVDNFDFPRIEFK